MLEKIFQIIVSPELRQAIFPLKLVFIIVALLVSGLTIYFLLNTKYLRHLWGEAWEDYLTWRNTYSLKAKKKKRDFSASTTDPSTLPVAPPADATKVEEAELNLKNGRIERTDWERILDKLESKKELNYKLAFIDADKLLNQALDERGKRLSKEVVSNANDVLKAKEVLEKMLTNPTAQLTLKRAKKLIGVYKKALSELRS